MNSFNSWLRRNSVTVAMVLGACFACRLLGASAQVSTPGEYGARVYTNAAGQTLPYRLLQPTNYDPTQKYPLVLFFHGAGERGNDNQKQLVHGTSLFIKPESRVKFPCFVFAPQCPD